MAPGKAGKHFKGDNPIAGRDPRGRDSYGQGLRVPGAPSQPGALPLWAALITQTASVAFWVKKLRELQRSGLPGDEGNPEDPSPGRSEMEREPWRIPEPLPHGWRDPGGSQPRGWKGSPGESPDRCPRDGGRQGEPQRGWSEPGKKTPDPLPRGFRERSGPRGWKSPGVLRMERALRVDGWMEG